MYAITGATGQLGRLTIKQLLKSVPAGEIIAAVRNPESARDLAAEGVQVRLADYDSPETLKAAFAGVNRLLLISSNLTTGRIRHHQAVIDAAKTSGVTLIAYTSMLHADRPGTKLAREHLATELALTASGIPATLLRNGWYTENYLMALQPALSGGALYGSAGEGRVSLASRADYAAAAAAALISAGKAFGLGILSGAKDRKSVLDELATVNEPSAQIARIIVTHAHYDHLGGATTLSAPVYVSAAEPNGWRTNPRSRPSNRLHSSPRSSRD
ncbi:MAG TPA: NAD(P)H-binding protein [Kaistia sp.]|nr:NAD(P)H-binding protein [Kaistia sp.]